MNTTRKLIPALLAAIVAPACGGGGEAATNQGTPHAGTAGAASGSGGGGTSAGGAGAGSSAGGVAGGGGGGGAAAGMGGVGGGAGGGGGSSGAGGAGGASVTATVIFPFVVSTGGKDYFPTYLAHLLGGKVNGNELNLACVSFEASSATAAEVSVSLAGYAAETKKTVMLPAGKSVQCLSPVPDAAKLYALSSPVAGVAQARVTVAGAIVAEQTKTVSILPVQTAFSGIAGMPPAVPPMPFHAVFATPTNPAVQTFYTTVANSSRWGGFGSGGYDMFKKTFTKPTTASLTSSGKYAWEPVYFEANESIQVKIDAVSCSLCSPPNSVDVYLLTAKQWDTFDPCSPSAVAKKLGATAGTISLTAPAEGWHVLALVNPCGTLSGSSVTFSRTGTTSDAPLEVMRATYDVLKAKGVQYVTVAANYFDAAYSQTIRLPEVSLNDTAANCIDGSMLFASILEKAELEPVVVYQNGHAFISARKSSGDPFVWPVETTMVGTDDFDAALNEGQFKYMNVAHIYDLDVRKQRLNGILPIPK